MIKVAIFDFDGTLANTLPDLKITINLTRESYGLAPVTEDDVLLHVNNHIPAYIRLMIPELQSEALWEEAEQRYYAFYDDHYLAETVPYPHIPEILEKLKADGVKLAVMSNKNHSHILKMVDALFPNTFDSVWGTIPEVPAKPNPARAFLIAEEFGEDIVSATHQHIFCDSAPMLERRWGVEAGLGFIGKNHQLIHPTLGSMVHPGEIVLNVTVDGYRVLDINNGCGACKLCMDACPTGALRNDVWDARKCIAYATHHCLECQIVCPHNKQLRYE
mgnify:CR=1 FL=1